MRSAGSRSGATGEISLSVGRGRGAAPRGRERRDLPAGNGAGGAWTRGAARLALATGVPLVPVRIVGTAPRALAPAASRFPKIRIVVGEPIQVAAAKPTVAASRELTRELQARVEALLGFGGSRYSPALLKSRAPYPVQRCHVDGHARST